MGTIENVLDFMSLLSKLKFVMQALAILSSSISPLNSLKTAPGIWEMLRSRGEWGGDALGDGNGYTLISKLLTLTQEMHRLKPPNKSNIKRGVYSLSININKHLYGVRALQAVD